MFFNGFLVNIYYAIFFLFERSYDILTFFSFYGGTALHQTFTTGNTVNADGTFNHSNETITAITINFPFFAKNVYETNMWYGRYPSPLTDS
jgi:hypothetical protein